MGAQNVGKKVAWSVRRLEGGQKRVEGTVLAYVRAGESVRGAVPRGARGTVKKAVVDRSKADRYLVSVQPEHRADPTRPSHRGEDRTPELYVPLAGTVDLALVRDGAADMTREELDRAVEGLSGGRA